MPLLTYASCSLPVHACSTSTPKSGGRHSSQPSTPKQTSTPKAHKSSTAAAAAQAAVSSSPHAPPTSTAGPAAAAANGSVTAPLLKDAFLVFRALCKLSIRTSDTVTVSDPTAVRGKVRGGGRGDVCRTQGVRGWVGLVCALAGCCSELLEVWWANGGTDRADTASKATFVCCLGWYRVVVCACMLRWLLLYLPTQAVGLPVRNLELCLCSCSTTNLHKECSVTA